MHSSKISFFVLVLLALFSIIAAQSVATTPFSWFNGVNLTTQASVVTTMPPATTTKSSAETFLPSLIVILFVKLLLH